MQPFNMKGAHKKLAGAAALLAVAGAIAFTAGDFTILLPLLLTGLVVFWVGRSLWNMSRVKKLGLTLVVVALAGFLYDAGRHGGYGPYSTPASHDSEPYGSSSSSSSSPDWKTADNTPMAYIMMEDFVEKRLKSPSTADFPGLFDGKLDHVTRLPDQTYRIESYVDAQNSFGATMRTQFVGKVKQTSEDTWRLQSLTLRE